MAYDRAKYELAVLRRTGRLPRRNQPRLAGELLGPELGPGELLVLDDAGEARVERARLPDRPCLGGCGAKVRGWRYCPACHRMAALGFPLGDDRRFRP